jgi:hypothetical protein
MSQLVRDTHIASFFFFQQRIVTIPIFPDFMHSIRDFVMAQNAANVPAHFPLKSWNPLRQENSETAHAFHAYSSMETRFLIDKKAKR